LRLGVPVIVGVKDATKIIPERDGAILTLDFASRSFSVYSWRNGK
jgi:phosphohistidine swiveling domain-containing protein